MTGPRAGTTLARSTRRWFWVFVAPFLVGLIVFVYVPLLWSLALSLFDARNTVTPTRFVGLGNYAYLLGDRLFLSSLGTFVVFALFIVRLAIARQLLQQTSKSIVQIGLACGFSSGPHFSSTYRNHFGITPREERAQRTHTFVESRTPTAG